MNLGMCALPRLSARDCEYVQERTVSMLHTAMAIIRLSVLLCGHTS